MTPIKV